jgi:DNA polymerase-3 subunit alpha
MKEILIKMSPSRFEDLIALVALYRPGPIGSGMIDDFIKRKKGDIPVKYELPQMKEILDETYGVILYQEQVMRIANKLANFSLGQADILRKAMGKKNIQAMEKQKEHFVEGAVKNSISRKKAERIFDLMGLFAEYGFNKSHSAAYAYVAFQTAYLKTHYPVEFMAATLSADMNDTDKIVKSINECRKMRIDVLPPDINLSGREFKVIGNSIRFGLEAVKGVGGAAIESIITVREEGDPFTSITEFIERLDSRKVNKKVLESLVKAGAYDSLGVTRASAMQTVSNILNGSGSRMRNIGQQSFFGEEMNSVEAGIDEWQESELLRYEKESLGFYITGHPLTKYNKQLAIMKAKKIPELERALDREEVMVGGVISSLRKKQVKSTGELMAYITLEDDEGRIDAIIFSDLYKKNVQLMHKDALILVKGNVDRDEKGVRVRAREISSIEDAGKTMMKNLEIELKDPAVMRENLKNIRGLVDQYPGKCQVILKISLDETQTLIETGITVSPDSVMIDSIENIVGKGTVTFS